MKYFFILLLSLLTITLDDFAIAGGWQQETRISQLMIDGSAAGERIYVQFENNFNPDSCAGNDIEWNRVYGNTDKGKYILSIVLSAKATGQMVVPLLHGCDDWGKPVLSGLLVK